MADYHLYYIQEYQVLGAERISAADDEEALQVASQMGDGRSVEVWNDHSRIGVVEASKAA